MAIFNSYVKLPEGNGVQEMFTDLPFFTWPQLFFLEPGWRDATDGAIAPLDS